MKIVIADTDNDTVEDLFSLLKSPGQDWEISSSNSGKQCLDILKKNGCTDVVVLGRQLIDMPGLDLINKIRDDSDIPIVVLSNERNIDAMVSAFDAGANDYVTKPYNEQIFLARLKALIRRRAWDKQAREKKIANHT